MQENQISITIPQDEFDRMFNDLTSALSRYKKYGIALTPEQRHDLPKMGDKTFVFVNKALEYSKSHPDLNPGYLDVSEWSIDVKAHGQIISLLTICEELSNLMNSTSLLCGSEAYTSALTFYNGIKQAAKMNVQGAEPILNDLSSRFPGRSISKNAE